MNDPDALLAAAETVVKILQEEKIDAVVIGAIALAAYQYVRQTEDLDLGVNISLPKMRQLTDSFRKAGYEVDFWEPEAEDPLGGVIDIRGSFGLVQVISFENRFPAVINDAVRASSLVVRTGSLLRVVPIPHLIALKLYAGGYKSKADIIELVRRNPELNLDEVRILCAGYGLRGIEELIIEADL